MGCFDSALVLLANKFVKILNFVGLKRYASYQPAAKCRYIDVELLHQT